MEHYMDISSCLSRHLGLLGLEAGSCKTGNVRTQYISSVYQDAVSYLSHADSTEVVIARILKMAIAITCLHYHPSPLKLVQIQAPTTTDTDPLKVEEFLATKLTTSSCLVHIFIIGNLLFCNTKITSIY